MVRMKRLLVLTIATSTLAATGTFAEDGSWMVRARAVNLDMANKSGVIPLLAVPADAIHVSNKAIPEVDISCFSTKNIAAELILTVPQKHDVKVTQSAIGSFKAGSFKQLPPTLTLQYHFLPDSQFRPYIGAGINYTRITSDELAVPGVTKLHLEDDSWGGALQAGFDMKLGKSLFLNLDVKKIYIGSDITAPGLDKISRVKVVRLQSASVSAGVSDEFEGFCRFSGATSPSARFFYFVAFDMNQLGRNYLRLSLRPEVMSAADHIIITIS